MRLSEDDLFAEAKALAERVLKDRVWVDPYVREGRPVSGYWREDPVAVSDWVLSSAGFSRESKSDYFDLFDGEAAEVVARADAFWEARRGDHFAALSGSELTLISDGRIAVSGSLDLTSFGRAVEQITLMLRAAAVPSPFERGGIELNPDGSFPSDDLPASAAAAAEARYRDAGRETIFGD